MSNSAFKQIRDAMKNVSATEGAINDVNPHADRLFVKRNVYQEQEWVNRHAPIGVIPMNRAYIYKTQTGQFYLSHQDPMHNQLQNNPQ